MKQYYILSKKHTRGGDYVLTWWGPDSKGYTIYLDKAGKYSEEQIKEKSNYYNDGRNTVAILCEKAESVVHQCVPWEGSTLKKMGISQLF